MPDQGVYLSHHSDDGDAHLAEHAHEARIGPRSSRGRISPARPQRWQAHCEVYGAANDDRAAHCPDHIQGGTSSGPDDCEDHRCTHQARGDLGNKEVTAVIEESLGPAHQGDEGHEGEQDTRELDGERVLLTGEAVGDEIDQPGRRQYADHADEGPCRINAARTRPRALDSPRGQPRPLRVRCRGERTGQTFVPRIAGASRET